MNTLKFFANRKIPVEAATGGKMHIDPGESFRIMTEFMEHLNNIHSDLANSGCSKTDIAAVLKNNMVNIFGLNEPDAEFFVRDFTNHAKKAVGNKDILKMPQSCEKCPVKSCREIDTYNTIYCHATLWRHFFQSDNMKRND